MAFNENVTQMLIEWNDGDESALERLTAFVYDELRRRAATYLRRERDADTMQATALVHEAYLQILDLRAVRWQSRVHFINTVAMLMRRILVDHARERNAKKRGSGERELPISRAERVIKKEDLNLVELNESLERFAAEYPRQAQVVELKFFGGLSTKEIADIMSADGSDSSVRTVERDWTFARTWLHRDMNTE